MTDKPLWQVLRDIVTPPPFAHNEEAWTIKARLFSEAIERAALNQRPERADGGLVEATITRAKNAEALIERMVNRFLRWKLPADFQPDNGISCQRPNYGPNVAWEPVGTNLLTYTQAEAMILHLLEGERIAALRTQPPVDATDAEPAFHIAHDRDLATAKVIGPLPAEGIDVESALKGVLRDHTSSIRNEQFGLVARQIMAELGIPRLSRTPTPQSDAEVERLRARAKYAAEAIRVHADKFPVPEHMRALADAVDELAALRGQTGEGHD